MEGKEKLRKKADHSRLVGGQFNKQRSLHVRLTLGGCETSRFTDLPPPNLKSLCGGLNWARSYIESRWSQHLIFSNLRHLWKWLPKWEQWAECIFQRQGGDEEPQVARVQLEGQPDVMSLTGWTLPTISLPFQFKSQPEHFQWTLLN